MFLTETAKRADIVFTAACAYEKDGTVTNTAGEVQLLRKAAEVMGVRSDFDILRILSHQLAKMGLGRAISLRTPEAALEEIQRNVSGYDVSLANLLLDRKSTRLNSSHSQISYAVFCLKKKKKNTIS